MQRRRFLACSAAAGLLAGGLPRRKALAESRADPPDGATAPNLGPLKDLVLVGSNGVWSGALEQGFYVLRNESGAGAVIYFTAAPPAAPEWLSVDVHPVPLAEPGYTAAGLLLNLTPDGQGYVCVALQPDGQVAIYRRGERGLGRLTTLPGQGLRDDLTTRLSVQQTEAGIDFFTNARRAGSIKDLRLTGRHGIVALDRGNFFFANFLMA